MDWFIDVLDPRAGAVFATKRIADLQNPGCLNATDNGPTFFIGPPSFIPERVERSVGFAMARAQGQLGLFVSEQEVPFDSLAEIGEFARRVYLGGAAGDDPAENGVPPPPQGPEGGEPPENIEGLPRMERGEPSTDPVAAWLALADEMRNKSGELPPIASSLAKKMRNEVNEQTTGFSSLVAALSPLHPTASAEKSVQRLIRGALCVLQELSRRHPDLNARDTDRLQWHTSMHRFVAIATRMGLWSPMRRELKRNGMTDTWERTFIIGTGHLEELVHGLLFDSHSRSIYWYWLQPIVGLTTDPFEDLAMLPVPPRTAAFAKKDGQNLQSLLSAVIAMPNQFLEPTPLGEERAELALFAAACLNLGAEQFPHWVENDDISGCFAEQLVDRTHTWSGQNSPRIVYVNEVESLIKDTIKIPA